MESTPFTHTNCRAVNERKSQIRKTRKLRVFAELLLVLSPVSSASHARSHPVLAATHKACVGTETWLSSSVQLILI